MCRAQASDLGSGPHPRNLEQPHAATSISIKSVGKARIRRPSPFHLDPTVNCPPDALGLASVMTRPKVPEDKRQRTATACDSCKRRKQKCNGLCPCITCAKRNLTCAYGTPSEQDDEASPAAAAARPAPKRRLTEEQSGNGIFSAQFNSDSVLPNQAGPRPDHQPSKPRGWSFNDHMQSGSAGIAGDHQDPYHVEAGASSIEHAASSAQPSLKGVDDKATAAPMSRGATTNGSDEEAVIYHQSRMLQDPTGRLLYVGDSATLSYLQLIRMMVENVAGPSPFTTDPRRHRIMESQFTMPSNTRHTHLLPDKKTAYVLVDAFFINTHGLVHMFDRQSFLNSVRSCYVDPLSTDPTWLCHLNLVFAIGLMLATPRAGTTEAAIIEKLLKDDLDRAEIFYLNAKSLSDPLTGFEDAGFWSIQALFLMAVYMLTKSKRNAAFAAFGMAVRSAYSLGLHREETMVIFSLEEQEARRNLWRSMYIMDRFLSCSLGRPAAISKDDCSGDTLNPPDRSNEFSAYGFSSAYPQAASFEQTGPLALEAAVRSCSAIGMILRKVYQQRRISTKLAQEIADICKLWPRALAPMLHWRQASSATPSQGVAILHVNLLYCHSIVLLTRPFFLFLLNAEIQKNMTQPYGNRPTHNFIRMEKFSDACVIASTHTVVLVQNAFEAGYLPRRNPAVIYFLFAAALVLLSNEFAGLHTNTVGDQCIAKCIGIVTYCGETDPQAARLVFILSAFRDVAAKQKDVRKKQREVQTNTMSSVSLQMAMQAYSAHPEHHSIADPLPTHIEQRHQQPAMTTSPAIDFAEPHPNAPLSDEPAAQGTTNLPQPPPMPTKPEPPQQPAQMFSPSTATPQGPALPPYERHGSLSSLLDLSALDNRYQSAREEDSSGAEENVDFDALWAWPSMTPAVGTPGFSGDVQEISDSAVPLFGLQFAE